MRGKRTVVVAALAVAMAIAVRQVVLLRHDNLRLRAELELVRAELEGVRTSGKDFAERNPPTNGAAAHVESAPNELLKLRNEVAQQRKAARDVGPQEAALKAWAQQILALKEAQNRMPALFTPEVQLASDKDWADAAWGLDLTTEDGVREAASKLRDQSVNEFFNDVMRPALKRYLEAHNDVLPTDLAELKGYLGSNSPGFDDEVFRRYRLLQSGQLSSDPSQPILELREHADPDYDSNHQMGINGASGGRYNRMRGIVEMAVEEFAKANGGQLPSVAAQVAPYLKGNLEPAAVTRYLSEFVRERSH